MERLGHAGLGRSITPSIDMENMTSSAFDGVQRSVSKSILRCPDDVVNSSCTLPQKVNVDARTSASIALVGLSREPVPQGLLCLLLQRLGLVRRRSLLRCCLIW